MDNFVFVLDGKLFSIKMEALRNGKTKSFQVKNQHKMKKKLMQGYCNVRFIVKYVLN